MRRLTVLVAAGFLVVFFQVSAYPDSLVLKTGEIVRGKIVEKTSDFIKIQFQGLELSYFLGDIQEIVMEEAAQAKESQESAEPEAGDIWDKRIDQLTKEDCRKWVKFYEEKLKSMPLSAFPDFGLGRCYYCLEDFDKALLHFKKSVSMDPDFIWGYAYLGITYKALGLSKEAGEAYIKVVEYRMQIAKTPEEYNKAWVQHKMLESS